MSNIETFFVVLALVATVIFFSGYVKGTLTAIRTHSDDTLNTDTSLDIQSFWPKIALAVFLAALVIGLVGVFPSFVYVGPALAMFTAIMNGMAFFIE